MEYKHYHFYKDTVLLKDIIPRFNRIKISSRFKHLEFQASLRYFSILIFIGLWYYIEKIEKLQLVLREVNYLIVSKNWENLYEKRLKASVKLE